MSSNQNSNSNEKEQILSLYERLKAVDPAALVSLQKLVEMAEKTPYKYHMAKSFL